MNTKLLQEFKDLPFHPTWVKAWLDFSKSPMSNQRLIERAIQDAIKEAIQWYLTSYPKLVKAGDITPNEKTFSSWVGQHYNTLKEEISND